jgi:heme-degrading monooxygenase HmoA
MTGMMTEAKAMTVRTWSATASPAGARDYSHYFAGTLLPQMRKLPGFAGAYLLSRDLDQRGNIELVAHTFWESPEAIRAFAGDDITASIVEPEAQAVLTGFDRTATHRSVLVDTRS